MTPVVTREALSARIEVVRAELWHPARADGYRKAKNVHGAVQSTLAILSFIYGGLSHQMAQLQDRLKVGHGQWDRDEGQWEDRIAGEIDQLLSSALGDYDAGLVGSVRMQAQGEILGDFIALARVATGEGEGGQRVAAVLVAAALEETLKQLGETNGIDVYNRDMRGVIQKLKDANVLSGAQPAVAAGYVKFRDSAFHGQFDQIERGTIESAAAFVEGLLNSRFS